MYEEYLWLFVVSVFLAVFVAWGIGANDVANSFGSSVGTKALTMGQAVIVAGICEFLGAVLLGANVADTIKSGIAKLPAFAGTPDLMMVGMTVVLLTTGLWLALATFLELPVSTSHSVVGSVVGMTIAIRGGDAVVWYRHAPEAFPYIKGMVPVLLSWFVSPILAFIATSILFLGVRTLVLRRKNSFNLGCIALPFLVGLTFFVIVVFIIQTGANNDQWAAMEDAKTIWIGIVCGVGTGLLTLCTVIPYLRWKIPKEMALQKQAAEAREARQLEAGKDFGGDSAHATPAGVDADGNKVGIGGKLSKAASATSSSLTKLPLIGGMAAKVLHSSTRAPHEEIAKDPYLEAMHASAEVFDYQTERLFRYLQVFTAAVFSFAHGSNDVANSIGPFATVYGIYKDGGVAKNAAVPVWILVVGGLGIILGIATYGYKIIRVIGVKMVHLTFARGFAVELGAAIVIVVASKYGLPVSSTQTLMGSIIAIGVWENKGTKGFNLKLLIKIFGGWIATLIVAGVSAGLMTAILVYTPNKNMADDRVYANKQLNAETLTMINQAGGATGPLGALNATLLGYSKAYQSDVRNVVNTNIQAFTQLQATQG